MAFGFPAYHAQMFDHPSAALTLERCAQACRALGWSIERMEPNALVASTPLSARSWSEHVQITLHSPHKLTITSQCAMPTQCFDWGKNRENVARLYQALHTPQAPQIP